jgi:hypothetical protein
MHAEGTQRRHYNREIRWQCGVSAGSKFNDLPNTPMAQKNLLTGAHATGKEAGGLSLTEGFPASYLPVGEEIRPHFVLSF